MKFVLLIGFVFFGFSNYAQDQALAELTKVDKGDYVILEVRMQMEDEFQTVEGNEDASLSRLALFTGKNTSKEVLTQGFKGHNEVVNFLNFIVDHGFVLKDTYSITGGNLIITHYVLRKGKR